MSAIIVSFQGRDADDHRIDAFSGIESAAGIARALTLIAHYVATGKVRHRFPFSSDVQFYLEGTEEGSFNWRFRIVLGTVAVGLATNAIYDIGKIVLNLAIGHEPSGLSQDADELSKQKSGDIAALVEAVEPALKKGHYGVGNTVNKIEIYEENSKRTVVTFDTDSKEYIYTSEDGGNDTQFVTVSALNSNDRTGRVFFNDLGRTVRFTLDRKAKPGSMAVLSRSLDHYVSKHIYLVQIAYRKKVAADGRLKSIEIFSAIDPSEEDQF